jgi:trk system potassium uptake protein TrkH
MTQVTGSLVGYPARVSFAAYLAAILVGSLLLELPAARRPGCPPVAPIDAVFTATSAVCVTGLTVRSTFHDFSPFGQGVILVLMQLGGLGIMTVTTLVSFRIGGQATLRQRALIANALGIKSGRDLRWVTVGVLITVLVAEAIGFLLLTAATWGSGPPADVCWRALFHTVSAFCNGGFALADDSFMPLAGNVPVNLVLCGLIIVGGLGFPVIFDLVSGLRQRRWSDFWQRLQLQTKLMLIGTAGLLAFGAAAFWALEWDAALAEDPLATRILKGLFHSTTCRTAGFNTVDYAALSSPVLFLTILLMAIGAGPCSTGGGFKVSTFMTLLISSWSSFRGRPRVNFFRRTIPHAAVERATATSLLFAAVAIAALVALLVVESRSSLAARPRWFLEALFECISALGTVGLSTGITPRLSEPGKIVIALLMLVGRLGPLTAAVALARQQIPYQPAYPEEEPLVG